MDRFKIDRFTVQLYINVTKINSFVLETVHVKILQIHTRKV